MNIRRSSRICPHCGGEVPITRLGAALSPSQAEIFDIINSCPDGIEIESLFDRLRAKKPNYRRHTIFVHITHINKALVDKGYKITKYNMANKRQLLDRIYYVAKLDRKRDGKEVIVRA